ncbi:glycosyltransferase [Acidimicrobiia bacterium]|nr:glycosyltransferase [Acidimicrobiia bacterium]
MDNLSYITYQTFPAFTANSIQTMANIKYLTRNQIKVSLYFPLRSEKSTDNLEELKKFYSIEEEFKAYGVKHNLPFGKFKIFNRILFLLSHLIWSYKVVKNIADKKPESEIFFTRSDWVFFFLSKRNKKVVFECHQFTKIRKLIINSALKNKTSKIIFLNAYLKRDYEKKYPLSDNFIVLHNGVDLDYFLDMPEKHGHEIVFIGKLKRFNNSRGIDFLLKGFSYLDTKYTMKIVGATKTEIIELERIAFSLGIHDRLKVLEMVSYSEVANQLLSSSIGILINSKFNSHSTKYTSPLKYFEYLAAGLKILAIDYPSHRDLPYSEKIEYFAENDLESFISAVDRLEKNTNTQSFEISSISLNTRAKKIIKLLNF